MWSYNHVSSYLAAVKKVNAYFAAHPEGRVRLDWAGPYLTRDEWRREFVAALHSRIALKASPAPTGRKYNPRYQTDLMRDMRMIHDYAQQCIVHPTNRLSTPELQRRFGWSYHFDDGLTITLHNTPRPGVMREAIRTATLH